MGIVRLSAPTDLILYLQEQYELHTFIETGTFRGGTTVWAASHFEQVITVENSRTIYDQVVDTHGRIANIDFRFGHSLDTLSGIVPTLQSPACFWLDDHWCSGETYGAEDECPILEEIAILNASPHNHFVLIDDARYFVAPPPAPHNSEAWPTIDTIIEHLKAGSHEKYIVIFEDVVIAVPLAAKATLAPWLQETISHQHRAAREHKFRQGLGLIRQGFGLMRHTMIAKARMMMSDA